MVQVILMFSFLSFLAKVQVTEVTLLCDHTASICKVDLRGQNFLLQETDSRTTTAAGDTQFEKGTAATDVSGKER